MTTQKSSFPWDKKGVSYRIPNIKFERQFVAKKEGGVDTTKPVDMMIGPSVLFIPGQCVIEDNEGNQVSLICGNQHKRNQKTGVLEHIPEELIVINGSLVITKKYQFDYLEQSPFLEQSPNAKAGQILVRRDDAVTTKAERGYKMDRILFAQNFIANLATNNYTAFEEYALALRIDVNQSPKKDANISCIIQDMQPFLQKNPDEFVMNAKSDMRTIKAHIKKAQTLGVLVYNEPVNRWNWKEGGDAICAVPVGINNEDHLLNFFLTDTTGVYNMVKTKIENREEDIKKAKKEEKKSKSAQAEAVE